MASPMSIGSFQAIWPFRIEDKQCQFDPDGANFIIFYFIKYIQVITDIIDLLVIPSVLTHHRRTKVPNVTIRQSRLKSYTFEYLHRYLPQVYIFPYIKPVYEFICSYISHW
jgi:hypothetical protein